jgi:hypothetical protein
MLSYHFLFVVITSAIVYLPMLHATRDKKNFRHSVEVNTHTTGVNKRCQTSAKKQLLDDKKQECTISSLIETEYLRFKGSILKTLSIEKRQKLERQLCDVKSMLKVQCAINKKSARKFKEQSFIISRFQEELPTCPICLELFDGYFEHKAGMVVERSLRCGHSVCTDCSMQWEKNCPLCRKKI